MLTKVGELSKDTFHNICFSMDSFGDNMIKCIENRGGGLVNWFVYNKQFNKLFQFEKFLQ